MTELFYRYKLTNNPWQGCQFWNRTFDEEIGKVDVSEVRQLIDENDEDEGDEQC